MLTAGDMNSRSNYPRALANARAFVARLESMRATVDANVQSDIVTGAACERGEDEFAFLVGLALILDQDLSGPSDLVRRQRPMRMARGQD